MTNYSYAKPMFGPTNTGLISGANQFLSGNQNPYLLDTNQQINNQLFKMPNTVQMPFGS